MLSNEHKLMLLRVNLYGAMQTLVGAELRAFWELIDEIDACHTLHPPPPIEQTSDTTA